MKNLMETRPTPHPLTTYTPMTAIYVPPRARPSTPVLHGSTGPRSLGHVHSSSVKCTHATLPTPHFSPSRTPGRRGRCATARRVSYAIIFTLQYACACFLFLFPTATATATAIVTQVDNTDWPVTHYMYCCLRCSPFSNIRVGVCLAAVEKATTSHA